MGLMTVDPSFLTGGPGVSRCLRLALALYFATQAKAPLPLAQKYAKQQRVPTGTAAEAPASEMARNTGK